jgi:hypothetical protein
MRTCTLLAAALLSAAGCQQKLDLDKKADLEPGDEIMYQITPPAREQRVTVAAKSGGVMINLFVLKAKTDEEAKKIIQQQLDQKQDSKETLAKELNKADPTIEATVPGGTTYYVAVTNPSQEAAKVTLKIAGREK